MRRSIGQITDKRQPLLTPHQNLLFSNQVRRTIRLKHMSHCPEKKAIIYYIYFCNKKHPEDGREEENTSYLTDLSIDKKVADYIQNIALSAIHIANVIAIFQSQTK